MGPGTTTKGNNKIGLGGKALSNRKIDLIGQSKSEAMALVRAGSNKGLTGKSGGFKFGNDKGHSKIA